jgi:hypothetical protein
VTIRCLETILGISWLLGTPLLLAQGVDLRGVVSDSASGERLPFVNVTIGGSSKGAATNPNGFYLIPNLPRGTYDVTARAIGRVGKTKRVLLEGPDPATVNFELSSVPIEVSGVVIEAGERREATREQISLRVLEPEEVERIPAAGQPDLLRSMQILPGVSTTADVSSKFYVRGGAGDQNLILLDGMKIYNPFHAFGIFSIFDPGIIKSTDLYTAAFPAGYGGRLSSVLNVTTRDGSSGGVAGSASIDFVSGKVGLEGPATENYSWILSARKSLFNDTFRRLVDNPPPVSFYDAFLKVTSRTETGRQSARGFFSGDDITSDIPDEPDYHWRTQAYALSMSGLVDNHVGIEATMYSASFSINRDTKRSTVLFPAESSADEVGLRSEVTLYTESLNLMYGGFELSFPRLNNVFSSASNIQRTNTSSSVEFWMWFRTEWTLGSFMADVGVHSDVVSIFDRGLSPTGFEPRINLRYRLSDDWQLKASYGLFTQNVITINNEDDILTMFEAWVRIPKGLDIEQAHHFVLGLDGAVAAGLSVGCQGYHKDYRSIVLYNKDKIYPEDPDFVNGTGSASGMEVLGRYSTSLVDLYAAYTLGWTTVTAGSLQYAPRYDRRHTLNLLASVYPVRALELTVRWEYGSGYPFTQTVGLYDRITLGDIGGSAIVNETGSPYQILGGKNAARLPAYHRLDASASYRFTVRALNARAGIHVLNLYGARNILSYDRKTGRRIDMIPFFPSATLAVEF